MMKSRSAASIFSCFTSRRSKIPKKDEKRAAMRVPADRATVHLLDDDGSLIPFESFDLSAGGIYLRSELLYYPGDELILQIDIPGLSEPLVIIGEVIRVDVDNTSTPGMGVAFWSLTSAERYILNNYLSR